MKMFQYQTFPWNTQASPCTPLIKSLVSCAVAPNEQNHNDNVYDEEHRDDDIAQVAVKKIWPDQMYGFASGTNL